METAHSCTRVALHTLHKQRNVILLLLILPSELVEINPAFFLMIQAPELSVKHVLNVHLILKDKDALMDANISNYNSNGEATRKKILFTLKIAWFYKTRTHSSIDTSKYDAWYFFMQYNLVYFKQ